jgi:hypothetical protein
MSYGKKISGAFSAIAGLWLFGLASCSPTHVETTKGYAGKEPLPRPDLVVVHPFLFSPEQISPNSAIGHRLANLATGVSLTEDQIKIGRSAADALADELVKAINELGLPAERSAPGATVAQRPLHVEGQFLSIDEGNRLRRMVIGFGAGGTEVRTKVQIYQGTAAAGTLLQEFETKAQSSKKPGMGPMAGVGVAASGAATSAAVAGGVGTATEFNQTVEGDARRTAREIAKTLSRFFAGQNWIPAEKAAK